MSTRWYYMKGGKEYGPISTSELKNLAQSGALSPEDKIRKNGTSKWHPALAAKGLFESIKQSLPSVEQKQDHKTLNNSDLAAKTSRLPHLGQKMRSVIDHIKGKAPVPNKQLSSNSDKTNSKEILEEITPQRLPEGVSENDIIFECKAVYRGGHPQQANSDEGFLYLTKLGIYFVAKNNSHDVSTECSSILDVLQPGPGTHSDQMISKAKLSKTLSTATRNLTRFAGGFLGGNEGAIVRAVGSTASGVASDKSNLGPVPKNRLVVIMIDDLTKHKITYDVMAHQQDEMEKHADEFYRKSALIRSRFYSPAKRQIHQKQESISPTQTTPGNPFNAKFASDNWMVYRSGAVSGPYDSATMANLLNTGGIAPTDLVKIEIWIPAGALCLLKGLANPNSSPNGPESTAHSSIPSRNQIPPSQTSRSTAPVVAAAAGGLAAGIAASVLTSGGKASAASKGGGTPEETGNYQPKQENLDSDGDGLPDTFGMDTDGDGIIDTVGLDQDGDRRIDAIGMDTDHDGRLDAYGFDRNNDGLIDMVGIDRDQDGEIDALGMDYDQDGQIDEIIED